MVVVVKDVILVVDVAVKVWVVLRVLDVVV